MSSRSRWWEWKPSPQILADTPLRAPIKPPDPPKAPRPSGSLIDELFDPRTEEQEAARQLMNRTGVRIMVLEDGPVIGIWSDLDGPHIRAALHTLEMSQLPVRYLDGNVPMKYKLRKVAGEPPSLDILKAMEAAQLALAPEAPWVVRDRLWKKKEKTK